MAFATIPAISRRFERATAQSIGFEAPAALPAQLLVMVVLPVTLGMSIRRRWPSLATERRSARLGLLLVLIISSDVSQFVSGLPGTVPLALSFIACSFPTGRNVGVASTIAVTLLGQPAFAFSGATDFLGEIPIMLLAVALYRNRSMVSPTEDAAEN